MTKNRYKPIINNDVYEKNMSYEEVKGILSLYKTGGFGGFAINGRSKNKVEDVRKWLEGYMNNVRLYCDAAKELELEMWIFDEWGFPSGTAAGLVLTAETRPKKLSKAIDIILNPGESFEVATPERFICAGVFSVNRFAQYNAEGASNIIEPQNGIIKYTADKLSRLVAVTWENVSFHTMEMRDISKMDPNDSTVGTIDIMDRACVRKFLDNMHERYAAVIGDEFGKTVKGFFYDEPEVHWQFPYSMELPEYFKSKFGYDMINILPEIVTYSEAIASPLGAPEFLQHVKKGYDDYTKAWNGMLAENFYGQIRKWCNDHNLLSVGHQDMDHGLETLNTVSGDFFENSLYNDMPGIDVIHDHIIPERFSDFPRYAGSVKRAYKKAGAMSETFAVMGPNMPPDVMRYDLEHQIMRGIDKFFLYQNSCDPCGGEYNRDVMERATFVNELLNTGRERTRVGIFIPKEEIAWIRKSPNAHHRNEIAPWVKIDMLAKELCYEPIEYDYVCEDSVKTLIDRGIDTLIITGDYFTEKTLEEFKKFHENGGTIRSVFKPCEKMPYAEFTYSLWQLKESLRRDIIIDSKEKRISMTSRETKEGIVYALMNESERFIEATIDFGREDILFYDMYSGEWVCWNNDGNFKPRELKLFKTSCERARKESIVETVCLEKWKFNGKEIDRLVPWEELGLKAYSGYGEYETEFDWSGGVALVDLGEVAFSAKVTLNDREYRLAFSPWCFKTELPEGHYVMKVEVLNTGASKYYDEPGWHRPFEQPYLRCGLLGKPKIKKIKICDEV